MPMRDIVHVIPIKCNKNYFFINLIFQCSLSEATAGWPGSSDQSQRIRHDRNSAEFGRVSENHVAIVPERRAGRSDLAVQERARVAHAEIRSRARCRDRVRCLLLIRSRKAGGSRNRGTPG